MSSKKKHRKKHFRPKVTKASLPATPTAAAIDPTAPDPVIATLTEPPIVDQIETPQLKLIRNDVRRVAVLATGFAAVQIILWYLFNNTGLGAAVYRLIQL